jgi:hypothetical protein
MKSAKFENIVHLFMILSIPCLIFIFSFQKPTPPKTYTVSLSKDEWVNVLQVIDSSQKMLIKSDLPAREVAGITSRMAQVNQTIQFQVSAQLQEEQKAAAKKDSLDHKPKK